MAEPKTIVILVGASIGAYLLYRFFKREQAKDVLDNMMEHDTFFGNLFENPKFQEKYGDVI